MSSADGPRVSHGASAAAVPEQIIGSYVVGETLGRGSFGKVKRGRHTHSGEPVAIKILNLQKLKSANMDKKIHREIEILRLFSHPNICRLYEVISTVTDMYLIMEYVEGGELYDYIVQKGRVRVPEARYIFQQIVCALEYCHHFRVVHRDLKPENILLGPGLQVKIIDFGLSNIMKDGEFLTTSCGSPNYAAPEVISGKLYFGPEVDVWSCGVILYALLCGCLPFDEDSVPLLFSKIKKGKYSIPVTMPSSPRELIAQILVVDPLVRLTIPQIRDNFWFNEKLPMRLSYNESLFISHENRIISVLASDTARKLNMREKDVRRELDSGQGRAHVTYNILLDARRRKEIAAEVRELGVVEDGGVHSLSGSIVGSCSATYRPKATDRELNMGLMLSHSPAMEVLLDQADATTNKAAYNSGCFVPASAQDRRTPVWGPSAVAPGTFSIRRSSSSFGNHSLTPHASSLPRGYSSSTAAGYPQRASGVSVDNATLLGANLHEQPRIGSVARKNAMYTTEEEQFIVNNNYGWRVGLMTDWHAEKALRCVYGVLKDYGMDWKVLSPFRLLARTTAETWKLLEEKSNRQSASPVHTSSISIPISMEMASRLDADGEELLDSSLTRDTLSLGSHPVGSLGAACHSRSLALSVPQHQEGNYFRGFVPQSPLHSEGEQRMESTHANPRWAVPASLLSTNSAILSRVGGTAIPPPANPVVMCVHIFRIHERHDKGYLVDFSLRNATLLGLDVVLQISNELVARVG